MDGQTGGGAPSPEKRAPGRPSLESLRERALRQVGSSRTPGLEVGSTAPAAPERGAAADLPAEARAFADLVAAHLPALERDALAVGVPGFRAARDDLDAACRALRDTPEIALDYLVCCSGVDYAEHIDVLYHLCSIRHPGRALVLKCAAPKETGAELPWLPSVTPIWPGANWHEREIFDLLGVSFRGHPDLRRILMPEGFDGGHPLRKDYVDHRSQRERKVRPR
jgi:NADH:ubiquinone oxidoreductase subunit C